MVQIELDIFSGRPNPQWTLSKAETGELVDLLRSGEVELLDPAAAELKLGYRGVIVTLDNETAALVGGSVGGTRFRVRSGIISDKEANRIAERWALSTAPAGTLQDQVIDAAESGIEHAARRDTLAIPSLNEITVLAACSVYGTSSTDFSFWNANSTHRLNNNCYNYAANNRTNTFAQPGRRSGSQFTQLTLANISAACKRDGWSATCSGSSLVLSLWIWPGVDYHFYRRTADVAGQMRWCHKQGQLAATNKDAAGKIITAPASCDRGDYNTGAVVLWYLGSSANVS